MGGLGAPTNLSSSAPTTYGPSYRDATCVNDVCWFDAEDDDSDDESISPISNRSLSKSGTRWARFFPELSSHFSLVSPVSTVAPMTTVTPSETVPFIDPGRHPSNSVGQKNGRSSLSSNELLDGASSCYSRRSSATSLGSEPSKPSYKSADAFTIDCPAAAGVFDDSESTLLKPRQSLKKKLSKAELDEKPLPLEPAIRLTPLSVRRREATPSHRSSSGDFFRGSGSISRKEQYPCYRSSLSKAADELEDTLASLTKHRHSQSAPLHLLDGPLQISRGNMDMIPSRPAPQPPTDVPPRHQLRNVKSGDEGKWQKKHKGPFHFGLQGFSRKYSRLHSRSLSNSNMRSTMDFPVTRSQEGSAPKGLGGKDGLMGFPKASYSGSTQQPLFGPTERELRLQLPRLQTKESESRYKRSDKVGSPAEPTTKSHPYTEEKETVAGKMEQDEIFNEKIFISSSKDTCPVTDDTPLMAFAEGPEAIYELDGSTPEPRRTSIGLGKRPMPQMPTQVPDDVVLSLLHQVCSLDDLFRFAIISRQFYRVFKEHELELIKSAVFTTSPPAWELREMSPPWNTEWQVLVDPDSPVPEYTPALYLQRYAQDIYTLAQLKSLILNRCETFLRPETIRGLAGEDDQRAAEVDDAFWRIWTFCRIFGCGKHREGDIIGQVDWLNGGAMAMDNYGCGTLASVTEPFGMNNVLFEPPTGFGLGNKGGLSHDELYNMTEIWTCLGVLLQPLHGRCREAREAGIFKSHRVSEKDMTREETVLEEWTYYVLTLGPSAVLNLTSIYPSDHGTAFKKAQSIGLTKWELSESGASRSSFFKEAVSKAYSNPPQLSPSFSDTSSGTSGSPTSHGRASPCNFNSRGVNPPITDHRRRQVAYAEQLRNQPKRSKSPGFHSFADERPISKYSLIMSRLEGLPYGQPPPPLPTQAMMASYVAQCAPTSQYAPLPRPPMHMYTPQVRDPVDQAIDMMVRELGFKEEDVKWALKITDSGEGINANAAVSLLIREHQLSERNNLLARNRSSSLLSSVISSPESMNSAWRWA